MLRMNRCPIRRVSISLLKGTVWATNPTKRPFLGSSALLSFTSTVIFETIDLCRCKRQCLSEAHFDGSSGPFRLDFWFLLSFWPWIRKSFFLRSFCRFSFSSSSFCFTLKCSLLCTCRCSLAFFIFWLCTVLRASSSARIWQGQNPVNITILIHRAFLLCFRGPKHLSWCIKTRINPWSKWILTQGKFTLN